MKRKYIVQFYMDGATHTISSDLTKRQRDAVETMLVDDPAIGPFTIAEIDAVVGSPAGLRRYIEVNQ